MSASGRPDWVAPEFGPREIKKALTTFIASTGEGWRGSHSLTYPGLLINLSQLME
jgi:hypothetical protein